MTWMLSNSSDQPRYFWLICFDDDGRPVTSVDLDVDADGYLVANLSPNAAYNVCVTAVTHHDRMDPTRCVLVRTGLCSCVSCFFLFYVGLLIVRL